MADKLINFRIPIEWHDEIRAITDHNGITMSEFCRAAIDAALRGVPGDLVLSEIDGYKQARLLASKMAHELLDIARSGLPDTYEEAVARYGFTPHGPEHNGR
mgnify:CR=1 FL=1